MDQLEVDVAIGQGAQRRAAQAQVFAEPAGRSWIGAEPSTPWSSALE